jgi:hypothetical protein
MLIGAIAVVASLECGGWSVATFYTWWLRDAVFFGPPMSPDQVAQNTDFALIVTAVLVANVLGTVIFIVGRHGNGAIWVLGIVHLGDLVLTPLLANEHGHVALDSLVLLVTVPAVVLVALAILARASTMPPQLSSTR